MNIQRLHEQEVILRVPSNPQLSTTKNTCLIFLIGLIEFQLS